MLITYIVGFILFGMYASYRFGQADETLQQEIAGTLIAFVILWPLALAVFVTALPFFMMYAIGVRNKKKKEK